MKRLVPAITAAVGLAFLWAWLMKTFDWAYNSLPAFGVSVVSILVIDLLLLRSGVLDPPDDSRP